MEKESYDVSYANIAVHRLMLDDRPRTLAYRNAISGNKSLIEGKTVMDVGCGTGILSIFCAQAGAKKVHAVECCSIAGLAAKVVTENNLESIVQIHECRVEDLVLEEKVDVIVSEWMGFYLVHEGMLQSVLLARDKFLAPSGVMFPESADLWVAACELPQYFEFWKDVYGVKMECVGELDRQLRMEPVITLIKPEQLLTEPNVLCTFSLLTITASELKKISGKILNPVKRDGKFQGICLWFVVNFPSEDVYYNLSTAPEDPETHWQQTAVILPHEYIVENKQPIAYEVTLNIREDDPTKYNMEVTMLDPEIEEHPTPCECFMTKCIVIRTYLEQTQNADNELEEEEPDTK